MMDEIGRKETLKSKYTSIEEKIAILDWLNSGELVKDISKELHSNESTVRIIKKKKRKKNKNKIRMTVSINSPVLRKIVCIKDPLISKIEKCLMICLMIKKIFF